MGTRNHAELPNEAYFVTTTTHDREPIFSEATTAASFVEELLRLRSELGFLLLSYVVMHDHVHLLIVPGPDAGLAKIMQHVKGRFARRFNESKGGQGKLWQARYYETIIRGEDSLHRRIEYIEQNPVAAGLAEDAPSYRFSSATRPTGDLEGYLSGDAMATWPG
jgi:REP element-mobilizing transposase RayT